MGRKEPFPQDRGWAWAIVLGSFVCVFFMVGTAKSIGLFLTEFQEHFHVPTSLAAMVMGGSAIVYAILAPVFIMLGQMLTVRKVIMTGAFIGFIGMSLGSLLFSMEYVIAVFGICFGIGNASIYGNILVMLGIYFRKRRSLANGLALAGASIGQFALPPFIEYLLETYGLQGSILLVGGAYFHVVAAASLFRPPSFYAPITDSAAPEKKMEENSMADDVKNGHVRHSNGELKEELTKATSPLVSPSDDEEADAAEIMLEREVLHHSIMASTGSLCICPVSHCGSAFHKDVHEWEEEKEEKKGLWQQVLTMFDFSVMKSYIAVFLLTTCFLCFFGYFNFILFLPAHVITQGIDKYNKAILVSLCGIGDLIGRLTIGFVGDHNFITRYKLMAVGSIVVGVNMGGLIFADTFGWMATHCLLYGISGGVYVSLLAVVVVDFVGLKNMPRLLAIIMLLQGLGAALGQPILGAVKDACGSFIPVFIICTVCSLIGGVILYGYPLALRLETRLPPERQLLPEPEVIQEEIKK